MIKEIETTWQKYAEEHADIDNSTFIFRGQSNAEHEKWNLTSSFNRYYKRGQLNFPTFIGQQLEENLFKGTYSEYEYVKKNNLNESNVITRLYHLQHYGVPTCFIDFTYNPLIALYFALTGIKGQSGGTYDIDGFPTYYSSECQITIFKIDYVLLTQLLEIKELIHFSNDLFINYEYYKKEINSYQYAHFAIDLNPENKINSEVDNYNLKNQESAFLMYDQGKLKMDLLEFISTYCSSKNIKSEKPIVTKYLIPYNTVFSPQHSKQPNYLTLFRFLMDKGISGKSLFNDHQGLKYDFNFFHHKGRPSE